MNSSHVIDAHILIWFLAGDTRLSRTVQCVLDDADSRLIVPASALAEACMAIERGRTNLTSDREWISTVLGDPRVEVLSLDSDIVLEAITLTELADLHDRFLVASVRVLSRRRGDQVTLITHDRKIIASALVPTLE